MLVLIRDRLLGNRIRFGTRWVGTGSVHYLSKESATATGE